MCVMGSMYVLLKYVMFLDFLHKWHIKNREKGRGGMAGRKGGKGVK